MADPATPNEPANISVLMDQHPQIRRNLQDGPNNIRGLQINGFQNPPAEVMAYARLASHIYPTTSLPSGSKEAIATLSGRAFRALRDRTSMQESLSWSNRVNDNIPRPQAAPDIIGNIKQLTAEHKSVMGLEVQLATEAIVCALASGDVDVVRQLIASRPEEGRSLFLNSLKRLGLFDEARRLYMETGEEDLITQLDTL